MFNKNHYVYIAKTLEASRPITTTAKRTFLIIHSSLIRWRFGTAAFAADHHFIYHDSLFKRLCHYYLEAARPSEKGFI